MVQDYNEWILEKRKTKNSPDWHDSDAPDAKGKFRDLGIRDLAAWLIKTRKGDMRKITGSLNQQVVFNRNEDPAYAKKMEKVREEVKRQLKKNESVLSFEEWMTEDFAQVGVAPAGNVQGMGNVVAPTSTSVGSGDAWPALLQPASLAPLAKSKKAKKKLLKRYKKKEKLMMKNPLQEADSNYEMEEMPDGFHKGSIKGYEVYMHDIDSGFRTTTGLRNVQPIPCHVYMEDGHGVAFYKGGVLFSDEDVEAEWKKAHKKLEDDPRFIKAVSELL